MHLPVDLSSERVERRDGGLTAPPAGRNGSALVLDVQSTGRVQHGVHKDVSLTLLQDVQHLLRDERTACETARTLGEGETVRSQGEREITGRG